MNNSGTQENTTIGVIADTHGKLSSSAKQALKGVDIIIHAGDIHTLSILIQLKEIAPIRAVLGNVDGGITFRHLPATDVVEVGEVSIYVLHNLENLNIDPKAAGFDAIIYGHSHHPENKIRNGVLFLNPGSASFPRRGSSPSIARLQIQGTHLRAELIQLEQ